MLGSQGTWGEPGVWISGVSQVWHGARPGIWFPGSRIKAAVAEAPGATRAAWLGGCGTWDPRVSLHPGPCSWPGRWKAWTCAAPERAWSLGLRGVAPRPGGLAGLALRPTRSLGPRRRATVHARCARAPGSWPGAEVSWKSAFRWSRPGALGRSRSLGFGRPGPLAPWVPAGLACPEVSESRVPRGRRDTGAQATRLRGTGPATGEET